MPKLALYVPKAEMKLVEKWRKRLNFSQIFMKALVAEIERQEAQKKSAASSKNLGDRVAAAAKFYESQMPPSETAEALGERIGRDQMFNCAIPPADVPQLAAMAGKQTLSNDELRVLERLTEGTAAATIWRQPAAGDRRHVTERFARAYLRGFHGAWQEISKHMIGLDEGE